MEDGYKTTQPQPNVMNIITIPFTDKEILEQAIQKAIDGGWDHHVISRPGSFTAIEISNSFSLIYDQPFETIFNHDFAKAFWGEHDNQMAMTAQPNWQYHLQQMVIADDPIKYLGENI